MNNKIEIIAEIGQAHEGSLGMAHSYIDAVSGCGVDTVKFQMHIAEAESSVQDTFRVKFSYEDKTRYDYWKRMEFTIKQWKELKDHTEAVGLNFLCTPFSVEAVEVLKSLGVNKWKIAIGYPPTPNAMIMYPNWLMVEYAITRLMSYITNPILAANIAVKAPIMATKSMATEEASNIGKNRATRNTPAATMVAA